MKIGIDIRETVHEKAGKGCYTAHLVEDILKMDNKNKYLLYSDCPVSLYKGFINAELKIINKKGLKWHTTVLKDLYNEKCDIFFAPTSYIIPALHKPKKLKVVMTVHDLVAFLFSDKHNKKAVLTEKATIKKALKKAAKVLAVSKNTQNDLMKRFKVSNDLIDIVPNAASDIFEPIPREIYEHFVMQKDIPEKFIFTAGTLEPRKNFPVLFKAFAKVLKEFPDYELLVAGKKGWMFREIFETQAKLGLDGKVKFLDYVPERDLVYLYNLATLFVYPSLYEGFGIPPLEAMKCGCPVVTSNISSLPEVVGDAAIKIDPNDNEALADAMISILRNDALRKDLIKKGFKQSKKYSWKLSARKFLDIIKSL
jgi:glycosyltransferase involved in cell wall biosynthesis